MIESYMLKIRELSLQVHLGCSLAEQEHAQEVRVSADIQFSGPPEACCSDRLDDTICYARICEALRASTKITPFWTVEKLAQRFLEILKKEAHRAESLRISVHKMHPPIDSLLGGVVFEIGDGKWR